MDKKTGSIHRSARTFRLAFLLAIGSFSIIDKRLVAAYEELVTLTNVMHALLHSDGRDTDMIEGYLDLVGKQKDLIAVLVANPAIGIIGLVAKAQGALLHPIEQGYDGAVQISISLCEDLVRLSRSG